MPAGEMGSAAWSRSSSSRVIALAILAGASCSVMVDQNRVQCATDGDCHARGTEFAGSICVDAVCQPKPDPTWGCLGSVTFPRPTGGPYTVTIFMRDLVTAMPIPGVTANLCEKLDTTCKAPISADIPTNAEGNLVLKDLRAGFDGYAELRAPGRMPGLYFFYPPLDANREVPLVPLLEPLLIENLAELNGKKLQNDRGHILLGSYNCQRTPAQGIRLFTRDADDLTSPFYVVGNIPKANAQETDPSGRGGFINLREGIVALDATVASDNRKIATVALFVRAGMITFTTIVPSP